MRAEERATDLSARRLALRAAGVEGWAAAAVAALAVYLVTLAVMPPLDRMPIAYYINDAAHTLLGVKLIRAGHDLHSEILTPLGGLAFLPFVWAEALGGNAAETLALGRLFSAAAVVLLAPLVAWGRLSAVSAALAAAALTATALMPMNLGEAPWLLASAMEYNKTGFALAGLGFLLLVPRKGSRGADPADAALGFAIATLAFHLKVTYALGLGAGMIAGFLLQRRGAAATAVALALVFNAAAFPTYLASIELAGLRSYATISNAGSVVYHALSNADVLAVVAAAAVLHVAALGRAGRTGAALALVVLVCSLAFLTQNSQRLVVPSAAVAPVLLYELARRSGASPRPHLLALGLVAALYPAKIGADWLLGLWHHQVGQRIVAATHVVTGGPFAGSAVRLADAVDASADVRDCRDGRLPDNAIRLFGEIEEILREAQSDGKAMRAIFVDHVDYAVLAGASDWRPPQLIWRPTIAAFRGDPREASIVFLPIFSIFSAPYAEAHGAALEAAGFRKGRVGCVEYYARPAR